MDGPFCVDCRHYEFRDLMHGHVCGRDKSTTLNLVTGKTRTLTSSYECVLERAGIGRRGWKLCGPEGRFFEAKGK